MRPSVSATIALALCLAATLAAWWAAKNQNEALAEARFQAVAQRTVEAIGRRMDVYAQILRGGLGLLEASDRVGRDEWRRYVDRLEIEQRLPGIQGIGFALKVPPERLERLEREIRDQGFPDFAVRPPGPRAVYYPIVYLEPLRGRNWRAFGYDMFSEPVRRAAMEHARDTGQATLTGMVRLKQEIGRREQAGTLLYLPYYTGEGEPADLEQRRRRIAGFVYAPFRMNDLILSTLGTELDHIGLTIWDGQTDDASVLFHSFPGSEPQYRYTDRLDVYGRAWLIEVTSTEVLEAGIEEAFPSIILIAGIIISMLVMGATQAMLSARQQADALAESNRALEAARARAEAANMSKSRFLAAASHDLRQPLQSMGIYLGLLHESGLPQRERKLAQAAADSFETTQRMLNSIMDIAALESGGVDVRPERIDAASLLKDIARATAPDAERKGLFLHTRICGAEVVTDRVMLERVVRNLVDNALKYTDRGGILIACRKAGGKVRIKVADSGPGIAAEAQALIFEDFYQIGNPERDRSKGLGLGLSIVARLSRLLGYRLEVKSRPGRGSSFIVVLPQAEET